MRFNVSSKKLYNCVSAVSKVINSKNAMAILNDFLFTLKDNVLEITASDLENTVSYRLEVSDTEGEGRFCVDARRMVDSLKELPDAGIKFDINDDNLSIKVYYPGGDFDFIGIAGDEYPATIESVDPSECLSFECEGEQVVTSIENTIFAVGTDTVRPQMMGILWDIKPEEIVFVATDTRKLVRFRNGKFKPGVEGSFILPAKPANILKSLLSKKETIKITLDPKSVTFSSEAMTFNSRFIKGNFPDYNRVIPTSNPYTLSIDRNSFMTAVRRVGVFVDPAHGLIKFKLEPDKIIMKAQDNNFCTSAIENVPCSYEGREMVIGFSAPYLEEIASTLSTDEMIVRLSDPSRPGVFVPSENIDGCDLLMLLMPMTVKEF